MSGSRLVPTGIAARALGIKHRTLLAWATRRVVTPELRTAGGHWRWDIDDLRRQIAAQLGEPPEA